MAGAKSMGGLFVEAVSQSWVNEPLDRAKSLRPFIPHQQTINKPESVRESGRESVRESVRESRGGSILEARPRPPALPIVAVIIKAMK